MSHLAALPMLCGLQGPLPAPHIAPDTMPPPGDELADHEAFEGVVEVRSSTHFSVKWGADWTPEDGWIEVALDGLERSWELQVGDLGFAEPDGMSVARFNAYVADSGVYGSDGEVTMVPGAGAFYQVDPDGWPFIAIAREAWDDDAESADSGQSAPGEWLEIVMAHEFHHACQAAARVYTSPDDHWWVEGTAVWAQDRQVPDSLFTWTHMIPVVALPELPLQHFDSEFWGSIGNLTIDEAIRAFRIYGTFVLPYWLAGQPDGLALVTEWATDDGGLVHPLDRLDGLMQERGQTLDATVLAMWAALLSGELSGSPTYALALAEMAVPLSSDHRVTGSVTVGQDVSSMSDELLPGRYGANVFHVEDPSSFMVVTLDAEPTGSAGTPVRWGLATIRCAGQDCAGEALGIGEGTTPRWDVFAEPGESVDLVLVPLTDAYVADETFETTLWLDLAPPDDEPSGCGCAAGGSHQAPWPLLLAAAAVGRRRRREGPREIGRPG